MIPLAHHIDNYMAIRRSLGFKLTSESQPDTTEAVARSVVADRRG
jgi:hypothetical protein